MVDLIFDLTLLGLGTFGLGLGVGPSQACKVKVISIFTRYTDRVYR